MPSGIDSIAAERRRQIEVKGYTPEHDMQHSADRLINAAKAYLHHAEGRYISECLIYWPWEPSSFKPSPDRHRDLEKAGALIAAAIDSIFQGN